MHTNNPHNPIYRALVTYSSATTGEIRIKIPSLIGIDSEVAVSYIGRNDQSGTWYVPDIGAQIIVTTDDDNLTNIFWVQTDPGVLTAVDGFYGAFSDYTDQYAGGSTTLAGALANTAAPMRFTTTDEANGVSILDSSKILFAYSGVYNLQWSGQFENTDNAPHDANVWLSKNGSLTGVVGSNGRISLAARKNSTEFSHTLSGWNFVFTAEAGDYYQFIWSTDSTLVSIQTYPITLLPDRPSTASLVLTVTPVSKIQSGVLGTTTGTGGADYLDTLTDVTLTSPTANQTLTYNGTQWVNTTPTTFTFDNATARSIAIPLPLEGMFTYLKDSNSFWFYSGSDWTNLGNSMSFDSSGSRSTLIPAPVAGMMSYLKDTKAVEFFNGTYWVDVSFIGSGFRNVIINGDMRVAQKTTYTVITTSGYKSLDRFRTTLVLAGTWAQSQSSDAPPSFVKSLSMVREGASSDATQAACSISQVVEGQNAQQFAKGTSSAKPFMVSFWVKSSTAGTYIAELLDANSRSVSRSYTISSAGVWEYKTILFPSDSSGVILSNSSTGLTLTLWLHAGTRYSSGTLQTSWGTYTEANRAVGQTNLATIGNYLKVTGVQLEQNLQPTPFERRHVSTELQLCQRYYYYSGFVWGGDVSGFIANNANQFGEGFSFQYPVTMRATPTLYTGFTSNDNASLLSTGVTDKSTYIRETCANASFPYSSFNYNYTVDAEIN